MTKKEVVICFIIPLILLLAGCNQAAKPANSKQPVQIEDTADFSGITTPLPIADSLPEQDIFNCVRGQAEPIVDTQDYPNTFFKFLDTISATETVYFDNGDKLIITNTGCEYYVLRFRFETSKFTSDTTNLGYWYDAASSLVTSMLGGLDAPIDIKRGLVYLSSYCGRDRKNNYRNLKLNDEIAYENNCVVTLEQIEKISDTRYAVVISFYTGPL
ncbi:MAG: hypothetical protein KA149_11815 [Chitinophagales bacterium]|nr:hypothetical protein [Chitinophagales bacterium]